MNSFCIVTMKTFTSAAVARDMLISEGIDSLVVSVDPSLTAYGCSYGVSFDCRDSEKVRLMFKKKKINYGSIIGSAP